LRWGPGSSVALLQVLFILTLLSGRTAFALDPARPITELAHRAWGSKSGVPTDIIALAQTTDGYLWVGSLRGLYRFDGIHFQKYEPESGAPLPSQEIISLFAAPHDRLWIGYHYGGVSVLQAGKLTNYNSADGFPEGNVLRFAQDKQGRVWAASSGGLACFQGGRWHRVGSESGFPGSFAWTVLVDRLGALWVAARHRVVVLPPHAARFELADEPLDGEVGALAESPDGEVWMAETTRAVRPLKRPGQAPYKGPTKDECEERFPETWKTEPRCRRPDDLEVRVGSAQILFDRNGTFWIPTLGDGLRRAPHPSQLARKPIGEFSDALEHFTSKDGLSSDVVDSILQDREGNIWVATRDGIDQFRNSALVPVPLGPAAWEESIAPDNDGYILALGPNGRMYRLHDAHSIARIAFNVQARWLYRDPFGSIWGIGAVEACRFVLGECVRHLMAPGNRQTGVWRLAVDGSHRLWAYVAEDGLFEFESGRWSRFKGLPAVLTGAAPTTQYTDPAGRVWFGFQDGRLLTVTAGRIRVYSPSEDGVDIGEVKAIAAVGARVWVGGERGLALLHGSRFTPVLPYDTPAFGSVSGIVTAGDGSLWLNEARGVVRIPPSEVSAILQDTSHRTHYRLFDSADGLSKATEQFFSAPTAVRGTDERLWFATTNGVAWVDPRYLYRNELPPPVVIQSVVADGRILSPSRKVELPGRTINLQIAYAGLSLAVPERVQFRYRLRGMDDDWQSAGTRRTAYYTRLPPGSYDFQVIATNDAGVWNETGAELSIGIIPAWYQTWWFHALCALLTIATLAALYRLRVAQVRAETHRLLEVRTSERERIARDLHDTLLQSFHGLLLQLQTAYKLLPGRPDKAKLALGVAIDGACEAATEGRDTVQGLRTSTVAGNDLAAAIKSLGQELAGQCSERSPVLLRVDVAGTPQMLCPLVRDEIYRIAGESLRNAFRHAGAKRIEVNLCYDQAQLRLQVRDDGKGIDPEVLCEGAGARHYGIHGMRERAKLMGAGLEVWTAPDSGTEVELSIPASRAYARPPVAPRRWSVRNLFGPHASSES